MNRSSLDQSQVVRMVDTLEPKEKEKFEIEE